ncbi:alpha/beta hydrolase [Flaviflexus salsibiostraticola]|uniref:prolyl aminopeptidase n=1 Tax=Flaviflexus salsibiostraticola TaxID=1282737 RepID=A0A3S8ZAD2_9ACTO|nr:alpha/beta hydrolase [Flaviflexus salsibiostraticola]AZN30427.1 alpha/beta hydrolase [Flaviflexus salsibiostraticola]
MDATEPADSRLGSSRAGESRHSRSPQSPRAGRLALATGLAMAGGAFGGLLLPRGAVTTLQAVLTVIGCLLLGAYAALVARSRWVLLVLPLAFAAAYETARLPITGPTVDGVRLDGIYGLLMFTVGRGIDGLVTLPALLVGAGWGLMASRRWRRFDARPSSTGRVVGTRIILGIGTVAVLALLIGLVRPASTEAITDASGAPMPGSISELTVAQIGGHDQHLMIRGHDRTNPVLLFLEGGPGGSALGRMRRSGEPLEEHFVVVTWDQRGTGKSYAALEPTDTLTVQSMTEDTLEVTDYLRERFGQDRIYLVGSSWGSIIGVRAVQSRPELFHAYVGTGQMVDPFETDALMYEENLDQARRTGDATRVARLEEWGPPPYEDPLGYTEALTGNPEWFDFPHGEDFDPASEYPLCFFAAEYTLIEQLRGMAAMAETFAVLYPQLGHVDFRQDVRRLDVPIYMIQGAHEAEGREVLAREWFDMLDAESKQWIEFDRSGHTPNYDEPGRFTDVMVDVVLAETRGQ